MGAAIRKNQGVGSPGVGLAQVKRVGGVGAQLPGRIQVVQLVVLVDCSGGVRVVVSQALVDVAVVHDGLRGVRAGCAGGTVRKGHPGRRCCRSLARLFGFTLRFGGLREGGGSPLVTKGREWGCDLRLATLLHLALLFGLAELLGLRNT